MESNEMMPSKLPKRRIRPVIGLVDKFTIAELMLYGVAVYASIAIIATLADLAIIHFSGAAIVLHDEMPVTTFLDLESVARTFSNEHFPQI